MYKLLVDGRNDYDLSFSAIYEKEFRCYDDELRDQLHLSVREAYATGYQRGYTRCLKEVRNGSV